MDNYITGKIIKDLREKNALTQTDLAKKLSISDKTVSKWETGRGLPDISMVEPIAKALGVSVIELMNGACIHNKNRSANVFKGGFYVCPVCGNVIHALGENVIVCCGVTLPKLEAEEGVDAHEIVVAESDGDYYVTLSHEMSKEHYISFIAYITWDRCEIKKLYPESSAEARFTRRGRGTVYAYCNQDGLFKKDL